MALRLKLKPKTLRSFRPIHRFSTSSPPRDDSNAVDAESAADSPPTPPPPSYSSYFSDIKERLKSPSSPPRRIPTNPPPPPTFSHPNPSPAVSLGEVRQNLAEFRLKSDASPSRDRPSRPPPISFQELFNNNVLNKPSDGTSVAEEKGGRLSYDSIRESLQQFRSTPRDQRRERTFNFKSFSESLRGGIGESSESGASLIGGREKLPDSIFGKELREKKGDKEGESEALKTEFVKMYSHEELGEKLRRLRPQEAAKGGKNWFSLKELNERLVKLRELEEKETESKMSGVSFRDLRESLVRLKDADSKKANMQRLSILAGLGGLTTPTFMLKPPQEHLMENFFHPDHMSSAEKMKLELKRVRDEFKMSESDCGSARVQIAQLTTKIKHLSSVLHKKDKHSRKGLHDMVQRRKKILKYLRRTDWDSYCLVLSKLGLRDVPEYKTPDYKS